MPAREPEPVIAVLGQIWASTAQACEGLTHADWDHRTDCEGWTVRDQLSHVIGTELGLLGSPPPPLPGPVPPYVRNPIGEANEAWVAARRSRPGDEVLAEFAEVTARRLAQLTGFSPERFDEVGWSPVGQVPYREFMQIRAFDSWVHEQDIRRALGRPGDRFGQGEELTLGRVASGMPYVVGRLVAPPEGTLVAWEINGPMARTVAVEMVGGRAHLREEPGEVAARLVLSSEAFVRLGCGRIDPEEALRDGEVQVEGDQELGATVVRSMNFMI